MLSEPIQIEFDGKLYRCCFLTQKIQADWRRWIERQELQLIRESQASMSLDEYDRALSTHRFKVKLEEYALGSQENERWMRTKEGFKYLMWSCFSNAGSCLLEDEMAALIDNHPNDFKDLWKQICEEYIESLSKKNETPGS